MVVKTKWKWVVCEKYEIKKMQSVKVEDGRKHVVQKELKKRKRFWEIEMEK